MKKLLCIKIIFLICSISTVVFASSTEDTIKGRIEGTFTDIGSGHKLFVGKGTMGGLGSFTVEMNYFFEYVTKYSGKAIPGSKTVYKFSDAKEIYLEITGGSWYVDFVPDPPEVIFELFANIIGGKGIFKNAKGNATGTGTQLYIPGTPTTFDFTIYVKY